MESSYYDRSPLLTKAHDSHRPRQIDPKPYRDSPYHDEQSLSSSANPLPYTTRRSVSPGSSSAVPPQSPDIKAFSYRDGAMSYSDNIRSDRSTPSPSRSRVAQAYNRRTSIQSRSARSGYSNSATDFEIYGIPPPITQSIFLPNRPASSSNVKSSERSIRFDVGTSSPRVAAHRSYGRPSYASRNSYLAGITRREKGIQADLQILLDSQSVGLMHYQTSEDISDAGSSTTLSRSQYTGVSSLSTGTLPGVVPVRQPKTQPMGLQSARKGIRNSLLDLVELKLQQQALIAHSQSILQNINQNLSSWQEKIAGFAKEIENIGRGPKSSEIEEMSSERSLIRNEIKELEDRLMTLRVRDSALSQDLQELENCRSAQASSYLAAKSDMEMKISTFLTNPNHALRDVEPVLSELATVHPESNVKKIERTVENEEKIQFFQIPVQHRTVEAATAYLTESLSFLVKVSMIINKETSALRQGEKIWTETITLITDFERRMKAEIQSGDSTRDKLRSQVESMDVVISHISDNLTTAEGEGWNLLICAIGAELEAFKKGRVMLGNVLSTVESEVKSEENSMTKSQCLRDQYRELESKEGNLERSAYHSALNGEEEGNGADVNSLLETKTSHQKDSVILDQKHESHMHSEDEDGDNHPPDDLLRHEESEEEDSGPPHDMLREMGGA